MYGSLMTTPLKCCGIIILALQNAGSLVLPQLAMSELVRRMYAVLARLSSLRLSHGVLCERPNIKVAVHLNARFPKKTVIKVGTLTRGRGTKVTSSVDVSRAV